MVNDFITALENKITSMQPLQPFIAMVASAPPNITLKYMNMTIPPEQIFVNNILLIDYMRDFEAECQLSYKADNTTSTNVVMSHNHTLPTIEAKGEAKLTDGKITLKSTLKEGQLVLVQPVGNGYVIVCSVSAMPGNAQGGA